MRTNIVIDDNLMAEAIKLSQLKTKKAVVETGLRLLIQIKKQERIKSLRGKLNWDGDFEKMIISTGIKRGRQICWIIFFQMSPSLSVI